MQGEQVYTHGLGDVAQVDPAVAAHYVGDYLRSCGALGAYPGLSWTVRSNGESVSVRVVAPLQLPLTPPGWDPSTTVSGEASAIVPVR